MRIPSDKEIKALHEKHAPSWEAFELVFTHCEIVCSIAEQVIDGAGLGSGLDIDLVRAGCLLHDLGVYRLYDDDGTLDHKGYVRHGVLGHELLAEEGLPQPLCRFCSCHTGMGLTRDDVTRQGLPIPPADYLAETAEERMVMYADKFHSKNLPPTFLTAATFTAKVGRYGADKSAAFTSMVETYGEPDLTTLAARYGHTII